MTRYHPILVTLHWLLAFMIIFNLIMGYFVLAETLNSDPEKIFKLKFHMGFGSTILAFMLIRLFMRVRKPTPPAADIGNETLNKLKHFTHILLYVVVILMSLSGIGIAHVSGLPDIVFFGSGEALPETFRDLIPQVFHYYLSKLLMILIIGHVAAFLYHQFVKKDGLFSRMWFGGNSSE